MAGLGHVRAATTSEPLDRPAIAFVHPDQAVLLAVARAGSRLVAVGERGLIDLSDDDGRTWRQARSPVSVTLTAVTFATPRIGWAVGHSGAILTTRDGGEIWQSQFDGRELLADVHLWLTATPAAASTEVGKLAQQMIDDGPDKPLFGVLFQDPLHGIAFGSYGVMLFTENGGESWRLGLPLAAAARGRHLYATQPLAHGLVFVGEAGGIYESTGLESPLDAIASPYQGTLFGVVRLEGDAAIAFGLKGHAMRTDDGGAHWTLLHLPCEGSINAGVRLDDGRVVLATQLGEVVISSDGGSSFVSVPVPVHAPFADIIGVPRGLVAVGLRGATLIPLP